MELGHKTCSKCKTEKPTGSFSVLKKTGRPGSWCKACNVAAAKAWKQTPKGKAAKYQPSEASKESARKYRSSEAGRAARHRYATSEKGKQAARNHYHNRKGAPESKAARKKAYDAWMESPAGKAARKEYRSRPENREKIREAGKRYNATEKGRECNRRSTARRRAVLKGLIATFTAEEWTATVHRQSGRCHYCRKRRRLTMDHVIPVSKGGHHVKENIVGACQECNSRKGSKVETLF